MAYSPTLWIDGSAPDLDAVNLNHLESGLQAAAAVADAALPVPAALAAGDFPVWNGSAWVKASALTTQRINLYGVTQPKITASTLAGGPPASPQDGDIWIATAVDANGTAWRFRYDSTQTTYKWVFVGGAATVVGPLGSLSTTSTSPVDLTNGPTLTLARGGDYLVEVSLFGQCTTFTGAYNLQAQAVFSTAGSGQRWDMMVATAVFAGGRGTGAERRTGIAAAETLKVQVLGTSAHTSTFNNATLRVTPIRVI